MNHLAEEAAKARLTINVNKTKARRMSSKRSRGFTLGYSASGNTAASLLDQAVGLKHRDVSLNMITLILNQAAIKARRVENLCSQFMREFFSFTISSFATDGALI